MTITVTLTQGDRIRLAREQAGLKQTELAMRLRVGRSTVANWENGVNAPSWLAVEKLASVLDVSEDVLAPGDLAFTAEVGPYQGIPGNRCNPLSIAA